MKVSEARKHIGNINKTLAAILDFEKNHQELDTETGFLSDAIGYLTDYRKALENAIENAKLDI